MTKIYRQLRKSRGGSSKFYFNTSHQPKIEFIKCVYNDGFMQTVIPHTVNLNDWEYIDT